MTFEQLESTLPNGLHDAILRGIEIDYGNKSASLDVDIDIQHGVRRGCITLNGLVFLPVEPPGRMDDLWPSEGLMIDAGPGKRSDVPSPPAGAFLHWIFVVPWNSFIHVAAPACRSHGSRIIEEACTAMTDPDRY